MQKKCNRCEQEKSIEMFHKHSGTKDGKRSICKSCDRNTCSTYQQKTKSKHQKQWRLNNLRRARQLAIKASKKRRLEFPWEQHYYMAKNRCTVKTRPAYRFYGARGIKFELTMGEVRMLWFRDDAHLLKKPSIDRIDSKGNYVWENCRFIEQNENCRKGNKLKAKEGVTNG